MGNKGRKGRKKVENRKERKWKTTMEGNFLWDIENNPVPKGEDYDDLIPALAFWLESFGFVGEIKLQCIAGNRHRSSRGIPMKVYERLEAMGVEVFSVGKDKTEEVPEQAADLEIERRLLRLHENHSKGFVCLLAGDGGYSGTVRSINLRQPCDLEVVWVYPGNNRTSSHMMKALSPLGQTSMEDLLVNYRGFKSGGFERNQ